MPSRRVLAIVFAIVVCAIVLFLGWHRPGQSNFQAAFQPGGTIDMDLSIGGYEIRGASDNQIRVEIDPSDLPSAHSEIRVKGNRASVRVEGKPNDFQAVIYVPQRSDVNAHQTIGQLRISGVEGDKNLGLNIGQILVEMPETEKLKSVEASVFVGDVSAEPWHTNNGGFFRSFHAGGQGNYRVDARLGIGQIRFQ